MESHSRKRARVRIRKYQFECSYNSYGAGGNRYCVFYKNKKEERNDDAAARLLIFNWISLFEIGTRGMADGTQNSATS